MSRVVCHKAAHPKANRFPFELKWKAARGGRIGVRMQNVKEKEYYKKKIVEMVGKIENLETLKRIYRLAEYLYVHNKEET